MLNYGSAGNGSAGHLAFEYLKMASNTFILHVPYRGTGPQLTDLMGGRLDAAAVGAPAVLQFIKTGKLRCIATGTTAAPGAAARCAHRGRAGLPGFRDDAVVRHAGAGSSCRRPTPTSWPRRAAKAVREPAAVKLLESEAAIVVGSTPAEFASFIAQEQKRWQPVIARAKIKPD